MTWTLQADRAAYKWARSREAKILHVRQALRRAFRAANDTDRRALRISIGQHRVMARIWRTRAASLEHSDHLGLPE